MIDLAFKINYSEFSNTIYNNEYKSLFEKWIKNHSQDKVSIIDGCLFATKDLDMFLIGIKEKDYVINGGPRKFRTEINYSKSFLSSIDVDFREALYNHNNYHIYQGNIYEDLYLPREKFSYENIHMNISDKKW